MFIIDFFFSNKIFWTTLLFDADVFYHLALGFFQFCNDLGLLSVLYLMVIPDIAWRPCDAEIQVWTSQI